MALWQSLTSKCSCHLLWVFPLGRGGRPCLCSSRYCRVPIHMISFYFSSKMGEVVLPTNSTSFLLGPNVSRDKMILFPFKLEAMYHHHLKGNYIKRCFCCHNVVLQAWDLSTLEAEAGGYEVYGHLGLQSDNFSQRVKQKFYASSFSEYMVKSKKIQWVLL